MNREPFRAALLLITLSSVASAAAEPAGGGRGASAAAEVIRRLAKTPGSGTVLTAQAIDDAAASVKDSAERAALEKWLAANRVSLEGTGPSVLDEQDLLEQDVPWGEVTYRPGEGPRNSEMYLHVFDLHVTGEVVVYGLRTEPAKAYLLADAQRKDLPFKMSERGLIVEGPVKEPPDAIDTVVVLEFTGNIETEVVHAVQSADDRGAVVLHARHATVYGRTVRYEPQEHKNTVGYWTDGSDRVGWHFILSKPGTFAVTILQGCGDGSGGSEVEFAVNGQVLNVTVQETGGFQKFVERAIGRVTLKDAGKLYTLTVTPKRKPGVAVMDLRQVTLTPVE